MSKITDFCIAECERQNDLTTESVSGMVEAYCSARWLYSFHVTPNMDTILEMAWLIKPQNKIGFRQTPVTFANGKHGLDHSVIKRAMENLLDAKDELSPEEFYIEFEEIHPFEDGNGRTGRILMNLQRIKLGLSLLIIHEGKEQMEYYKWFKH